MDSPPVPSPRVKSPALVDTVVRSRSATATTSRRRGLMKAPSPRDAASRTALQHKVRDDAVELGALVVERLAALAHPLLARAERAEVLDRLGHDVAVEAHHHPAGGRAADGDVEEDLCGLCVLRADRCPSLPLELMRFAASRASDGRLPRELMRLDASRAPDGRDSWKVTAVQTLDLVPCWSPWAQLLPQRRSQRRETRHEA